MFVTIPENNERETAKMLFFSLISCRLQALRFPRHLPLHLPGNEHWTEQGNIT